MVVPIGLFVRAFFTPAGENDLYILKPQANLDCNEFQMAKPPSLNPPTRIKQQTKKNWPPHMAIGLSGPNPPLVSSYRKAEQPTGRQFIFMKEFSVLKIQRNVRCESHTKCTKS